MTTEVSILQELIKPPNFLRSIADTMSGSSTA